VSDWFQRCRQDWIAETLQVFGFINREHLRRKFDISNPQASKDLATFLKQNPKLMRYNVNAKRYEKP
jgi:hypothetical protein